MTTTTSRIRKYFEHLLVVNVKVDVKKIPNAKERTKHQGVHKFGLKRPDRRRFHNPLLFEIEKTSETKTKKNSSHDEKVSLRNNTSNYFDCKRERVSDTTFLI